MSTNEGSPADDDDSYLGYSTAVGDLDDDGHFDVAVGMPRGANLTGKVSFQLRNKAVATKKNCRRWSCLRPT